MQKEDVAESVIKILRHADWEHSHVQSSCFDLLGRGDEVAVMVKIHGNVDSATRQQTMEMKQAAMYLSASPLIVGKRNSRGELEKQVIYERYGVPTINPETLESYLRLQEQSYVMNKKGGYYVSLDTAKIEEKRKEAGYSINALAKEVGVSAKTIRNYRDRGVATVEKAKQLEKVLGNVVDGVDIFDIPDQADTSSTADDDRTVERFLRLGMDAAGFRTAPFDAAARDDEDRFIAKRDDTDIDTAIIDLLLAIDRLAESTPFLISDRDDTYGDISAVADTELQDMESKDELKDAVRP